MSRSLVFIIVVIGLITFNGCGTDNRPAAAHLDVESDQQLAPINNEKDEEPKPSKIQAETVSPELAQSKIEEAEVLSAADQQAHNQRVNELLAEAKAGQDHAILWLGNANINRDALIKRIRNECMGVNEVNADYLVAALAKLGDQLARNEIYAWFTSGSYQREEVALSALEYIGDQWALNMLTAGLEVNSGPRKLFSDDEFISNKVMAPPLRYACVAILAAMFPDSKIQMDVNLVQERDVIAIRSFMLRAIPIQ